MPSKSFDSVLNDLIRLTVNHTSRRDISAETHFVSDLALSSLKIMDIMADVEDLFQIDIPLEQLPEIRTVGDAAQRVANLLETKAG
jgi:acyl carrier protein